MSTLQERLEEVMRARGWQHADLVRVSGQSSSVVSQWLGKGSKIIKEIGKLEAALAIEAASGYSALWVATGKGPRMAASRLHQHLQAREPQAAYATTATDRDALEYLRKMLARLDADLRAPFGDILAGWARDGAQHDRSAALLAMLDASGKPRLRA